jgi:hypothetical protein
MASHEAPEHSPAIWRSWASWGPNTEAPGEASGEVPPTEPGEPPGEGKDEVPADGAPGLGPSGVDGP